MKDADQTQRGDEAQGALRWISALPDAAAFLAGLAIAWYLGWNTRDLVWSLWLSSLLVGYSIIVWKIFGPALQDFLRRGGEGAALGSRSALAGIRIFGGLFLLLFFTVHFGMFHFVHSVLLSQFFPIHGFRVRGFPKFADYLFVLRQYWPFVIVAAIAERGAYRPSAIQGPGGGFMVAYTNVIRMHLLIFFFFFAHFARLENFAVYAVVYAVYFFPWRLVRGARAGVAGPRAALSR
jgi:hypothetical protein